MGDIETIVRKDPEIQKGTEVGSINFGKIGFDNAWEANGDRPWA